MPGRESPLAGPSLAERLLLATKRAGLTQTDLARQLHTDSRVLRRYLSGERIPPPEMIEAWERVCGLAPGELEATENQKAANSAQAGGTVRKLPKWSRWAAIPGAVVILVAGIVIWRTAFSSTGTSSQVDRPGAQPCPAHPKGAKFLGRTFKDGVVVRQGASQDFPQLAHLAGNCFVGFRGFCVGQPVADVVVDTLDSRWFIVSAKGPLDGGLIASGVIDGNPTDDVAPMACAGSRSTASHLSLTTSTVGVLPGELRLHASAPGADIVGYAVLAPIADAASPLPVWQQLDFVQAGPDFSMLFNQPHGPHFTAGDVTVIAVVCLAAGAPTKTEGATVIRVMADGTTAPSNGAAAPDSGTHARNVSCRTPTG